MIARRSTTPERSRLFRPHPRTQLPALLAALRARLAWRRHRYCRSRSRNHASHRDVAEVAAAAAGDGVDGVVDTQRGAATVLTVAMAGVLLLAGTAAAGVSALVVDHRRAQAAADLAALAAAAQSGQGPVPAPCTTAARIASANGATLRSCRRVGPDVVVAVAVQGPRWFGRQDDLTASARAGPSTP
ncbi:Rv3654c family TadE-like protein [Pimelobacter simplex]|uniref:Rv3654c family TadE-like protein n=1 Tax=Nocardioides simplex TaxID=2045 RepID=UPI003AAAC908